MELGNDDLDLNLDLDLVCGSRLGVGIYCLLLDVHTLLFMQLSSPRVPASSAPYLSVTYFLISSPPHYPFHLLISPSFHLPVSSSPLILNMPPSSITFTLNPA